LFFVASPLSMHH